MCMMGTRVYMFEVVHVCALCNVPFQTCLMEVLCLVDSINTFRLSIQDKAKMSPERAARMVPRGSFFLLAVTTSGRPFRLACTVQCLWW